MAGVSIKNMTRSALGGPRRAFSVVAADVLPGWDLSLVFVSTARAQALNKELRGKSYTPNVLSYVVGDHSGEIIICPAEAKKQAPDYQLSATNFILYLFIHGALHIKGWPHGAKMEQCEQTLMARYATGGARTISKHGTTHSNRHRHRDVPSKDGRRRGTL